MHHIMWDVLSIHDGKVLFELIVKFFHTVNTSEVSEEERSVLFEQSFDPFEEIVNVPVAMGWLYIDDVIYTSFFQYLNVRESLGVSLDELQIFDLRVSSIAKIYLILAEVNSDRLVRL